MLCFFLQIQLQLIQPMDQGIIEKLKRIYRKQILRHLLLTNNEENVISFYQNLNLKDSCYMLAKSWQSQLNNGINFGQLQK